MQTSTMTAALISDQPDADRATLVSEVDGALHVKNIPEPPPPEPVTRPMELYINGELVSKWDE
ncbi:putative tail completion protein R [Escherichia coli p0305293.7]|nr:putative tail completion protein R [Escherichia coli p0305293.7]